MRCFLTIYQLSTINCQLSTVVQRPSPLTSHLSPLTSRLPQLPNVHLRCSTSLPRAVFLHLSAMLSHNLSTVNCQLSTINCQLSTFNCQLSCSAPCLSPITGASRSPLHNAPNLVYQKTHYPRYYHRLRQTKPRPFGTNLFAQCGDGGHAREVQ